jgi:hypothetical protein
VECLVIHRWPAKLFGGPGAKHPRRSGAQAARRSRSSSGHMPPHLGWIQSSVVPAGGSGNSLRTVAPGGGQHRPTAGSRFRPSAHQPLRARVDALVSQRGSGGGWPGDGLYRVWRLGMALKAVVRQAVGLIELTGAGRDAVVEGGSPWLTTWPGS